MTRTLRLTAYSAVLLLTPLIQPTLIQAQAPQPASSRLSVFFDCEGFRCDGTTRTFYRTEIDWVNWVNVREGADVYVIMTSEGNASGGRSFQIDFAGT